MKHLNYCYKPLLGNLWETTLRNYHDISNFQLLVSYLFMHYHSFHKITIPNKWCFYFYIELFYKILQELHESYTIAMSMIKKWFNKMDGYCNQHAYSFFLKSQNLVSRSKFKLCFQLSKDLQYNSNDKLSSVNSFP